MAMPFIGLVAAVAAVLFLGWTQLNIRTGPGPPARHGLVCPSWPRSRWSARCWPTGSTRRLGLLGTAATIALAVVALFLHLYPNVMPSSTNSAFNLTITTPRPRT